MPGAVSVAKSKGNRTGDSPPMSTHQKPCLPDRCKVLLDWAFEQNHCHGLDAQVLDKPNPELLLWALWTNCGLWQLSHSPCVLSQVSQPPWVCLVICCRDENVISFSSKSAWGWGGLGICAARPHFQGGFNYKRYPPTHTSLAWLWQLNPLYEMLSLKMLAL